MGGWWPPWEGISVDDSLRQTVWTAVRADLEPLWDALVTTEALALETAEGTVRDGVLAIGVRVLAAGLAARGTGKGGSRRSCPCGGAAVCEGYRAKQVQTVVDWVRIRRAYSVCGRCGPGHCPLEAVVGLARDSLSPGVRRLTGRCGALLACAEAARTLAETARGQLSPRAVRTVTEAVGARREAALAAQRAAAWTVGLPAGAETPATTAWAEQQLGRLAQGQAATLAAEWTTLPCRGETAAIRDAQVTYFTNQAPRMAYDRYRAQGWNIGSGMVESACKHVIAAREKGPGMRWSETGAHTVAAVRVLLLNDEWDAYDLTA